jgi:hypothetical protein
VILILRGKTRAGLRSSKHRGQRPRSALVLFVAHVFHPFNKLSVLCLLDGDMSHRGIWASPMPMTAINPTASAGFETADELLGEVIRTWELAS